MSNTTNNTASQVQPGVTVINESTFETIAAMIRSSDPADHLVAQMLLVQVNVEKSIFWIWKLSKINSNRMVNLRTKAGRAFRDATSLFFIATKSAHGIGSWLIQKGWMTDEIYGLIKNDLINEEKGKTHSNFYKYSIELRDDLKYLDPNDKLISIHTDGD